MGVWYVCSTFKFSCTPPKPTSQPKQNKKKSPNQQANSVSFKFIYFLGFIVLIIGSGQKPYAVGWTDFRAYIRLRRLLQQETQRQVLFTVAICKM